MAVMNAASYLDAGTWADALRALNDELERRAYANKLVSRKDLPRIMLTGSPIVFPNLKIPLLVEEAGGMVVADETCMDEFPRGIKIGDSIEDVFTKFPCANTKLQQWKEQRLYGAYENAEGKVYCFLEYRTYLASYRIIAQDTGREHIAISFSKANGSDPNKVNGFEWFME
jgi:benzoyl-CoA reductase/2-hydroxyglutaryl-CoA dehydratase subunit BcrC/BadD/HgdB